MDLPGGEVETGYGGVGLGVGSGCWGEEDEDWCCLELELGGVLDVVKEVEEWVGMCIPMRRSSCPGGSQVYRIQSWTPQSCLPSTMNVRASSILVGTHDTMCIRILNREL